MKRMAKELNLKEIPIALHLDHGANFEICKDCIEKGFSSVMIDGSSLPYEKNIEETKKVVEFAHKHGVTVEGELGVIGSLETGKGDKEDGHGAEGVIDKKRLVTDPDEAERFVAETNIDALAVAVGTSHGAYKFTRKPTGDILAIDVIEKIHAKLPNTHMVMHGSSSVPQELQDIINAYGGAIPQTFGVPVEEIVRGIKSGVRKVNVDTDCRMAITGAIRKVFAENPKEFDPRKYLKPALEDMKKVCIDRYVQFGAAGQADKIKPVPLSVMAKRYA
jgi:fructose-bisphosphate aldolase class II